MMNATPAHAEPGMVTSAPELASDTAPNGRTPIAPYRTPHAITDTESDFASFGFSST